MPLKNGGELLPWNASVISQCSAGGSSMLSTSEGERGAKLSPSLNDVWHEGQIEGGVPTATALALQDGSLTKCYHVSLSKLL